MILLIVELILSIIGLLRSFSVSPFLLLVRVLRVLRALESAREGLIPVRLQIRSGSTLDCSELQGQIEEINHAGGTFRVSASPSAPDERTELLDKRQVLLKKLFLP